MNTCTQCCGMANCKSRNCYRQTKSQGRSTHLGLWIQVQGSPLAKDTFQVTSLIMLIQLFIAMLFSLASPKQLWGNYPSRRVLLENRRCSNIFIMSFHNIKRFSQCPVSLSMVQSSRTSEHIKKQHPSLTHMDFKYYASQMLEEKHSTKEASQGRKREGCTRGLAEYSVSETTPPELKKLIE